MNSTRQYTMGSRAEQVAATRDRIARSALALFMEEAIEDVTLNRVATAAGVSHQTVLNHFHSKEGVMLGAAEIIRTETVDARFRATPGDVARSMTVLISEYERMGDANVRWAGSAEKFELIATLLDDARTAHQEWLVAMFGEQLPLEPIARQRTIHALHVATDTYTWKLLRRDLGLSRAETERIMKDLVMSVLGGTDQ